MWITLKLAFFFLEKKTNFLTRLTLYIMDYITVSTFIQLKPMKLPYNLPI